jgi:hypothetical protein
MIEPGATTTPHVTIDQAITYYFLQLPTLTTAPPFCSGAAPTCEPDHRQQPELAADQTITQPSAHLPQQAPATLRPSPQMPRGHHRVLTACAIAFPPAAGEPRHHRQSSEHQPNQIPFLTPGRSSAPRGAYLPSRLVIYHMPQQCRRKLCPVFCRFRLSPQRLR